MDITPPDIARTIAMDSAALAMTAVPNIGALLDRGGEKTDRYDTSITPPGYAFSVWAPIFAGIVANAAQSTVPSRLVRSENRRVGWPLAAAYGLNTLWSAAAQTDRFRWTPLLLPSAVVATVIAHRRLQAEGGGESIASTSTGLLLGWTSLAAVVNISAATRLRGADPGSRASVALSAAGSAAASSALATVIARSRRGWPGIALASGWGLATSAFDRRRPRITRFVSGVGAAAVLGSGLCRIVRLRRR